MNIFVFDINKFEIFRLKVSHEKIITKNVITIFRVASSPGKPGFARKYNFGFPHTVAKNG